jgi:hypothetical protein
MKNWSGRYEKVILAHAWYFTFTAVLLFMVMAHK